MEMEDSVPSSKKREQPHTSRSGVQSASSVSLTPRHGAVNFLKRSLDLAGPRTYIDQRAYLHSLSRVNAQSSVTPPSAPNGYMLPFLPVPVHEIQEK